jgi:hypothetical protein
MSSLVGWHGTVARPAAILRRMAEVMAGPRPVYEQHAREQLAVATVQPAAGESTDRIACSDDGRIVVAFAGYLFTEDDAERRSPARHCLRLYRRHGREFPGHLNGSFAVVVYDAERCELHLVTDRLETRSLYYCVGTPFLFATEIKAILEFPGLSRRVNTDRILEFLLRKRLFGPATYYDHILRAPEASVVTWDGTSLRSTCYWRPPFDAEVCWDVAENARRVYCGLSRAVRRACAGAKRPGLLLSGGLDSRMVATASPKPLLCMTMHAYEGREVRTARSAARRLGHDHRFHRLPDSFPLELVTQGSLIADGRNAFIHAQALYLEHLLQDEGVDAALTGRHMETYFCETNLVRHQLRLLGRSYHLPLLRPMEGFDIPRWIWNTRIVASLQPLRNLVPDERLRHVAAEAIRRIRARVRELCDGPANQQTLATIALSGESSAHHTHLNVAAVDRLAPAITLPCDTDLLDLFFTIPPEHRLYHRLYAHILTHVDARARWVPYSNTGLPVSNWLWPEYVAASAYQGASRLVEACVQRVRPDTTFTRRAWPSFGRVLRADPRWHTYLRERATESKLVDLGLFPGDPLRRLIEDQIAGRRNNWVLIGLWITVEEWLSRYG